MWDVLCSGDNLSKVPSPPYCNRNALVAIVGPTGAGKSELALRMAEELDGEIVSCDSMQIYRGFDIGTAKLSLTERRGVPHHLIDTVDPDCVYSAGDYARDARARVREITARGRLPIVAGGTGFYLRALLDGLPDLPPRDNRLRERLNRREVIDLYLILNRIDSTAAERLGANDRMRIVRAIEVRLLTGKSAPPLQPGSAMPDYLVRKLALAPPRKELYQRLDERTTQMFQDGLTDEVCGLLRSGVSPEAKPFESVGYRQALAVVQGRMSREEAILETQRATRNYAKRQITWFRNDTGVKILPVFGKQAGAGINYMLNATLAIETLRSFTNGSLATSAEK